MNFAVTADRLLSTTGKCHVISGLLFAIREESSFIIGMGYSRDSGTPEALASRQYCASSDPASVKSLGSCPPWDIQSRWGRLRGP